MVVSQQSVHVEKIYRTRENLAWCQEADATPRRRTAPGNAHQARGIRLSGLPLGRPPKNPSAEIKKQAQEDESFRNAIEGKFGQAKRRFGYLKLQKRPLLLPFWLSIFPDCFGSFLGFFCLSGFFGEQMN